MQYIFSKKEGVYFSFRLMAALLFSTINSFCFFNCINVNHQLIYSKVNYENCHSNNDKITRKKNKENKTFSKSLKKLLINQAENYNSRNTSYTHTFFFFSILILTETYLTWRKKYIHSVPLFVKQFFFLFYWSVFIVQNVTWKREKKNQVYFNI